MGVQDYSPTAASNIAISGIAIQGSSSIKNGDNALRQLMADTATGIRDGSYTANGYVAKAAGYTVVAADRGKIIDCTAALTLSLTAAATVGAGFVFIVKANGGAVTIDPNGTENINGASTAVVIPDGSSALIGCTGAAWHTAFTISTSHFVTLTGAQTLTGKTLTGAALNGTLGATTPSTVAGTTGTFSGAVSGTTGTFSGALSGAFVSSDNGVFAHSATGSVLLRPNGAASTTAQMTYTTAGVLTAAGNITANSDRNLKENIEQLDGAWAWDAVKAIPGVRFDWKASGEKGTGFIAQDIEEWVPDVVHHDEDGIRSVAYGNLVSVLWEAVKHLGERLENLEARK